LSDRAVLFTLFIEAARAGIALSRRTERSIAYIMMHPELPATNVFFFSPPPVYFFGGEKKKKKPFFGAKKNFFLPLFWGKKNSFFVGPDTFF